MTTMFADTRTPATLIRLSPGHAAHGHRACAPSVERNRARLFRTLWTVLVTMFFVVGLTPGVHAATSGTGSVSAAVSGFVEISVTDSTIAAFSASPSSSDPGPVVSSTADGFTFSNLYSNTRAMFDMDITAATDSGASSTETIQGTTHTIADWIYIRQDSGANFGTYETTGTFDATAADYTAPGGFTKDSQGTFTITYYDASSPTDGGDGTTTVNWIYDSSANKYMFDTADKDFSNANGEAAVWPSSKTGQSSNYAYSVNGNGYVVTSVAGSASNYVPTVRMGWQVDYSTSASVTQDAYALIDFPSGTPADTYSFTLTSTVTQLTA